MTVGRDDGVMAVTVAIAVVAALGLALAVTVVFVWPRPVPARRATTAVAAAVANGGPLRVVFSGPDRVLTTEHDRGDGALEATSGTVFVRRGRAWSGKPDAGPADPDRGTTNSSVLRARTTRGDFRDVRVRLRLRSERLAVPKGKEPHAYDGVSLGLRYRSPAELYYVNVQRRDGLVTIKRKDAVGGGRYTTLATASHPPTYGRWVTAEATVHDVADGGVAIALSIDGALVVEATDRPTERARPIRTPGRVLVRGDNCEFSFDDLAVEPFGGLRRD